jgi:S-DNA-T family DNA segregation ATPase FtsK/SpoIIIE
MPQFTTDEIVGDNIQKNIIQKLNGLGFRGIKVNAPIPGPIVTVYPLNIPASIDIKKILNQSENIALATGVEESVDIRRVGNQLMVYVPNSEKKIVDFKEAMYWFLQDDSVSKMKLPILIGQDTIGNNKALDLAEQPHILIAGSTGAGKSVFLSNVIASLVMLHEPNELELDLIDTKGLDLPLYESLPHVCNLVESIDDWYLVIDRLIGEVSARNLKLKKKGVRNISEYNSIVEPNERMAYVVVIIDELADLLEKDKEVRRKEGKEHANASVTDAIKRLISICRASGMHIIACTQRTSIDVVSGTIKANFPTRISLKLPSGIDSRVILGQNGAENLLGKGDMLIQENDSALLRRYHSPFIRIEDVRAILEHKEMILQQLARPRLN